MRENVTEILTFRNLHDFPIRKTYKWTDLILNFSRKIFHFQFVENFTTNAVRFFHTQTSYYNSLFIFTLSMRRLYHGKKMFT